MEDEWPKHSVPLALTLSRFNTDPAEGHRGVTVEMFIKTELPLQKMPVDKTRG